MGDSNMRLFADQLICSILQLLLCYEQLTYFVCIHSPWQLLGVLERFGEEGG